MTVMDEDTFYLGMPTFTIFWEFEGANDTSIGSFTYKKRIWEFAVIFLFPFYLSKCVNDALAGAKKVSAAVRSYYKKVGIQNSRHVLEIWSIVGKCTEPYV